PRAAPSLYPLSLHDALPIFDVRVVAVGGLVLDVRGRDRDAAGALLGRFVDLVISGEGRPAGLGQDLGDGCRQRRLAMVHVPDREIGRAHVWTPVTIKSRMPS